MEKEILKFTFEGTEEIRAIQIDGEPWLVGKDVATILGYKNTKDALSKHVDDEDKLGSRIATSGQNREMTVINESGLYSLILSSKLPTAKKFKHWVTSEVLPAIRKHGAYMTDSKAKAIITDKSSLADLLQQAADQLKAKDIQIEEMKPKVGYYDQVIDKNGLTNFRDTAKMLGWKPKVFNQLLEDRGYIYRTGSKKTIKPYAEYVAKGYFEIKDTSSGFTQTLITAKGRSLFNEKWGKNDELN